MRVSVAVLLCSMALCAGVPGPEAGAQNKTSGGQAKPVAAQPSVFSSLFSQPTGMNGYEEWVRAGDLIRDNDLVDAATEPGATLSFKRRVLADPNVMQALTLFREGLNKPVMSPRTSLDENTPLPELAMFRKLARLLKTEQYVAWADGNVDRAIDNLNDGLNFGYRMQTDTVISGLVGIAVDSSVLNEFSHHLDQLSARDCDRIVRLVNAWNEAPSPAVRLLKLEKQYTLSMLDKKRNDPKALLELIDPPLPPTNAPDSEIEPEDPALTKMRAYLSGNPPDLNVIIEQAKAQYVGRMDRVIANLMLPVKERKPLPPESKDDLGGMLCSLISFQPGPVTDKYDRIQAMIRMLGIHAAVRRYRWEHDHLPETLAELRLGDLTSDPFTGDTLVYQRTGETYDLHSRGPHGDAGSGGNSVPPMPVRLPTVR